MKIRTPILQYADRGDGYFSDKMNVVHICAEHAKSVLGMKRNKKYRVLIYTKKPKKKAMKFRFCNSINGFFSKDKDYELTGSTIAWLTGQLGIPRDDLASFEAAPIWVRVKKV